MEPISHADELAKLADLHQQGILTDSEFTKLKSEHLASHGGRLLRRSESISVGVAAVVVVALVATLLGVLSPASPKVPFSTTDYISPSQVQQVIAFAMKQVGNSAYNQKCLQLMRDAYLSAGIDIGSSDDAASYWRDNPRGYGEHPAVNGQYGTPPAGAILFWGARPNFPDGHAALSLGDGTVVSSAAYPYSEGSTNGLVFSLSQRSATTYAYVGYIVPGSLTPPSQPTQVAAPPASTSSGIPMTGSMPNPVGASQLQPAASGLQGGGGITVGGSHGTTNPTNTPPLTTQATTPPPPPPTQPTTTTTTLPAPPTYSEQEGHHGANTFSNYSNASGQGPAIAAGAWVQVQCKVYDPSIASASPDGYWYLIASSPWNGQYWAVANTFMNGDSWGCWDTNTCTHNTDYAVPSC